MTTIQLQISNATDVQLLLAFAKRLNVHVLKIEETSKTSAIHWLEQLAAVGGISAIEDPVAWQREVRKDRALPYRN